PASCNSMAGSGLEVAAIDGVEMPDTIGDMCMIAAALLLSAMAGAPPTCAHPATTQQSDAPMPGVRHVFQNGERYPLKLFWIDPQGRKVDQGS
ncbi:hypothetical protein CR082_25755, partial [Salmonella enterica subsp. enterica serovar Typhimurium]